MKKIDVFNHIYPNRYLNYFLKRPEMIESQSKNLPALVHMDQRLKVMDELGIDVEIISLALPNIDDLSLDLKQSISIMRAANDGIKETAENSSGRFKGIGTVSILDVNSAITEAKRCIKELDLLGIQIVSNVNGEPLGSPQFEPFYSAIEKLGVPLWIHPTFMRKTYPWLKDFDTDIMVGWDYDTTLAMIHLTGSGVIERHKNLKIIVHHLGSMIPVLAGRVSSFLDRNNSGKKLQAPAIQSLKAFYVDTAEGMSLQWLKSGIDFFDTDHILFGTDFPWGNSKSIIDNIETLNISENDKNAIFYGNVKKILKV